MTDEARWRRLARETELIRQRNEAREALRGLLGIGPKKCGHEFDCICATKAARAALGE